MTQCYSPPSGSAVARMPGDDAGRNTNLLPSPPISVPPGYHYYQMHGTAYFLKLSTGEKVNLGPVESGSSSSFAVTPTTIKKERGVVKIEPVSSKFGGRKRAAVDVALLDPTQTKCRRSAADDDIEVVEILTDDDDDDSAKKTCDLPNTCDFAFAARKELFTPSLKKGDGKTEESDGGETVLESQEEDLLLSSDS
jgi:hypothetical protein